MTQRDQIVQLGCHRAQGFYLSHPECVEDLEERLVAGP
jgi:EAL domain-containing protein (putative c-di-GMP-specific phosphodiesterase class I)